MNDPMSDKNACQLTWPHSINTILLLFECTMHKPSEQLYFDFWLCFVFHDDECTKSKTESSVQGGGDILPPPPVETNYKICVALAARAGNVPQQGRHHKVLRIK